MSQILYWIVAQVAKIHNYIMYSNTVTSSGVTDKQLHFIVMGALGLALLIVTYFVFKLLKEHPLIIAFIYAFTVMVVVTFAIEIGQGITGTGAMEMQDVTYGMAGFLVASAAFAILRGIVLAIMSLFRSITDR